MAVRRKQIDRNVMMMENNSNVVVEGKEEKFGCFGDSARGGGDKRIEIWCWWC